MFGIRRREFITALGGAAVAGPRCGAGTADPIDATRRGAGWERGKS